MTIRFNIVLTITLPEDTLMNCDVFEFLLLAKGVEMAYEKKLRKSLKNARKT